jgi:hypothetical protein
MKNLVYTLSVLLVWCLFFSCSIEKRKHLSGYYIEWPTAKSVTLESKAIPATKVLDHMALKPISEIVKGIAPAHLLTNKTIPNNAQTFSTNTPVYNKLKPSKTARLDDDSCDVITFKNGNEIRVKVLEITPKQIKYRYCDPAGNEIINEDKSTIFSIKYPNGTKEIIHSKGKDKNAKTSNSSTPGNSSQIVALLLCIFIGTLGVHRFYLGHMGMGILYLLTGGLCGVGVLIDMILIITGDLKPKNGDYSEKL